MPCDRCHAVAARRWISHVSSKGALQSEGSAVSCTRCGLKHSSSRDQARSQCVRYGSVNLFLGRGRGSGVEQTTHRRGHGPAVTALTFVLGNPANMQGDLVVDCEEARRDRQVELDGVHVREPVGRQRRVVGNDPSPAAPQCPANVVVFRPERPVREAEDASVNSQPVPRVDVVLLRLIGVADGDGLGR